MLLLFLCCLTFSCSTKKNTFTRRSYHNLTAHFNAYFNGNESMKEGVAMLSAAHVDDYTKILPVYRLGLAKDAAAVNPQMDRAYKKASLVIQRHSIFIGNNEYCKWIDDSYFMIAKSHFYKRDYRTAIEVLEFINRTYKSPLRYDALLWIAKSYIQLDKLEKAQLILDDLKKKVGKAGTSKSLKKEYPLVCAELAINQKDYNGAIEHLQKALKEGQKKRTNIRIYFILGQLYERNNKLKKAASSYAEVLHRNPPYEMAFNAKINMANCFEARTQDSRYIKKQLGKMLKDVKNKEFQDQIYYALAEVYFKEKDSVQAIEYLKKSARLSVANDKQKALSFLKLARIYFNRQDYVPSQQYYDSTLTYLPKDFPDYTSIKERQSVLSKLVENILVVQLEDSLQRLSKLSVTERNKIIDDIIAQVIKDEQKKQQEDAERQQALLLLAQNTQQKNQVNANTQTSSWYFYNSSSVTFGYAEFAKKFGNRKLEDNWRISNKETVSWNFTDDANANADSTKKSDTTKTKVVNIKDRNSYLKNIPSTPEQINQSNEKIAEALYNMGNIYRDGFMNYELSNESFESLCKRFPNNENLLRTYYYIYKNYLELKNKSKSDYYKNLIITKFPDSDYAKLIQNPNYITELSKRKSAVAAYYDSCYFAYTDNQFVNTINLCSKADSLFKNNMLLPKFELLKAFAIGKSQPVNNFEAALNVVVTKYPSSEEKTFAQNIIDAMKKPSNSIGLSGASKADSAKTAKTSIYKHDAYALHLYVLIVNIKKSNLKEIKYAISDFNTMYYELEKLTTSNYYLDDKKQIITIANFQNKAKALNYMQTLNTYKDFTSKISSDDVKQFVISVDNYTIFYKDKNIDQYYSFFEEMYLK